ncbi:MAG: site-specific integrase [Oscillospiraceae bacterium]|nr:site-specific integrase [Oscillospiraceae bacterium]
MKAQKLKSGSYRYQVYAGKDANGKAHYVSFTHPDRKEAERLALEFKLHHKAVSRDTAMLTVGEAMDKYIKMKDGVLSPTTLTGYKRIRDNCLRGIIDIPLRKLSQEQIQCEINEMAKMKSPKYVRNAHGLLSAVLTAYHPKLSLNTTLPQKNPRETNIPTESEIKRITDIIKGSNIELPVLLALCLGLRMSEIRGIERDAIKDGILHIKQAMVYADKRSIIKTTKSKAGQRKIPLPSYLLALINQQADDNDYIVPLARNTIYKSFSRLCEKNGLPHFTFHSLRHVNASVMLALGVPDKYAMERGGWATNNVMKNIYQHTFSEQRIIVDNMVNSYFDNLISHETSHG